jgi:hypothetical protein
MRRNLKSYLRSNQLADWMEKTGENRECSQLLYRGKATERTRLSRQSKLSHRHRPHRLLIR